MSEIIMNSSLLRQPDDSDPLEIAIKLKLKKSLLKTAFARDVIKTLIDLQTDFFEFALLEDNNPVQIFKRYQELLTKLASATNATIVSGSENLQNLLKTKGLIIITNHLGIIKLTKIDNSSGRFNLPMENFEPFPLRHASLLPIVNKLHLNLHETAIKLPSSLSDVQKACGVLLVDPDGQGRTKKLINDTRLLITEKPAIVMYPEGGTTGKRNQSGPYDLDSFHSGSFVVSGLTELPILPVCQYFNPISGFELSILNPINIQDMSPDNLNNLMLGTRANMQQELNRLQS